MIYFMYALSYLCIARAFYLNISQIDQLWVDFEDDFPEDIKFLTLFATFWPLTALAIVLIDLFYIIKDFKK